MALNRLYTKEGRAMTELKFRAWIPKEKRMFYQDTQYLGSFIRRAVLFISGRGHEKYVDGGIEKYLMRYIGRKDINGVEIYDGDIITRESKNKKIGHKRQASWTKLVEWRDGVNYNGWNTASSDLYKVIGNKFENPDLL